MEFLQDWVRDQVVSYGYLAVFVLMGLNSACVPIPSEVTLLFGGAICSATFATVALGDPGAQLSFFWVCVWGIAGGMVGSWLAYWMGAAGGRPLIDRWGRYLLFKPHEVDRAHDWFERYGERVVFFARVLPVIHTFISLPAGVARMDLRRFSLFTLLGSSIWTVGMAYAGYALGENWELVERWMQPIAWFFIVLIVAGIAWWIIKRTRRPAAEASDEP